MRRRVAFAFAGPSHCALLFTDRRAAQSAPPLRRIHEKWRWRWTVLQTTYIEGPAVKVQEGGIVRPGIMSAATTSPPWSPKRAPMPRSRCRPTRHPIWHPGPAANCADCGTGRCAEHRGCGAACGTSTGQICRRQRQYRRQAADLRPSQCRLSRRSPVAARLV